LGRRDDITAELARVESDVAVVDARAARDTERLASSANAKEAQGLEHELVSLAKRKSDLEDAQLELMERLETAQSAVLQEGDDRRGERGRRSPQRAAKEAVAAATARGGGVARPRGGRRACPPICWRCTTVSLPAASGPVCCTERPARRAAWSSPEPICRRYDSLRRRRDLPGVRAILVRTDESGL
jgi:hypothetical protein